MDGMNGRMNKGSPSMIRVVGLKHFVCNSYKTHHNWMTITQPDLVYSSTETKIVFSIQWIVKANYCMESKLRSCLAIAYLQVGRGVWFPKLQTGDVTSRPLLPKTAKSKYSTRHCCRSMMTMARR